MPRSSQIEQRVAFGLDDIEADRRIEMSLRDLIFTYQTIGELIAFFHDHTKYFTLENVTEFIGDREQGALGLLWEIYYQRLNDVWPEDIQQGFDQGKFDLPMSQQ